MRSLLNTGWDATSLLVGFAGTFGFATLTGVMALWAARGATKMTSWAGRRRALASAPAAAESEPRKQPAATMAA